MADTVFNHQEIIMEEKKTMHLIFDQVGRAHELTKVHMDYKYLPSFCLVTDTTNLLYCSTAKYWSPVSNPPTKNKFSVRLASSY